MYRQIILSHLVDYLKLKKDIIQMKKSGKIVMLNCPFCGKEPMSANIIPNTSLINCFACKKKYNLLDIAKLVEKPFPDKEEEQLQYLKDLLKIDVTTKKDETEIGKLLDFYVESGFDLVPIVKNNKRPIEKDWTNKEHKDKDEWERWIATGLNIGVKTGIKSRKTIIDIDQKPIPEEIKKIMGNTLVQESNNGFHLVYEYDEDLPKTRIDELKIDVENEGGQVVIAPSVIDGYKRKFVNLVSPIKMPKELKDLLLSKITVPRKTISQSVIEDIEQEIYRKPLITEGEGRNDLLIRLGGILRKELNLLQTEYTINILNKMICDPPLEPKEIRGMMGSLDKYVKFDEQEMAHKILQYLKDAEEATKKDIELVITGYFAKGEVKKRIDKTLVYLLKEGFILKRGRNYHSIKKAEWKESLIETGIPIDFKMPYFHDVANFNWGDLVLIGSNNKKGKTHISMNIVKQLVEQGKKVYYISLETGSRFAKIALQLGLKEGDFYWDFVADPTKIELEPNAITIIDWLLVIDKAKTDLIFKHFVEQLYKTNGFLIIFMQLKQDNNWFAPNMAEQFPALACKYIYDDDEKGEYGKFKIPTIREPKIKIKSYEIPCHYNWQTKELRRIDELKKEKDSQRK